MPPSGLQHLKIPLTLVKRSWLTKSTFQAKNGIMSDLKLLATILYRMPELRRTNKGNTRHKLVDIIVITLCAIICRCDSFVAVEYLGHEREEIKRNSIQMLLSISQSLQTATLHILRLKKGMGVWRRANTGSALILGGLRSQTVGKA